MSLSKSNKLTVSHSKHIGEVGELEKKGLDGWGRMQERPAEREGEMKWSRDERGRLGYDL
jgi:hypothetical protein